MLYLEALKCYDKITFLLIYLINFNIFISHIRHQMTV